ncbi:M56 family metallopeptidase [Dokdonia sp.]|uniref:M56 family metallopeptidase n=1 Tax=Dokdonia sp. TaxID=2024995 RepID=UPI003262FC7F
MERYVIEVLCFQAIFLVGYILFLKKETFFLYNRLYLISTPLLAIGLPFLKIEVLQTILPVQSFVELLPEVVLGTPLENTIETAGVASSGFTLSWQLIYFIGIGISLLVFGYKIIQFIRLFKYRKQGERVITLPDTNVAFTFLRYIFLGDKLDTLSRKQILTHEYVHVKQKHTWDLLLFEVLRVVLWFNPFIYLYQREVSLIHEYLADEYAVGHTSKQQYYEELLNTAFGTKQFSFINTFFNHSIIKKRIVMLQKTKSKQISKIKYAIILPLVLSMLIYVSCSEDTGIKADESSEIPLSELLIEVPKDQITEEEYTKYVDALKEHYLQKGDDLSSEDLEEFAEKVQSLRSKLVSNAFNRNSEKTEIESLDGADIPFSVIDQVPTFPECSGTNQQLKECMTLNVSKHVNREFDVSLAGKLGLTGINRIFVAFKIDKQGNVVNIRTRAPHPDLETEATRVIQALPKMQPGEQNGKPVGVLYSLPITFKIES